MSQGRDDFDFNIEPNWDDMDLSWLDNFDSPAQTKKSAPTDPIQSHFEPEPAPRHINQPRQIPTEPEQRPTPAQHDASTLWGNSDFLWEEPAPIRREPVSTAREPASPRRESDPPRREAPQNRRPAPPSGRSVPQGGRNDPPGRRGPQQQPRRSAPQSGRGVPQNGRNVPTGGRGPQQPRRSDPSPWDRELKGSYQQKSRRKSNAPLIILIVLLVAGMGFAGWRLGSILLNYHRDRSAYNSIASNAISMLADFETGDDGEEDTGDGKTHSVSEIPIAVDWNYLRTINANVVGWLYCPGTVISYPVVQTSDHDYYLNHGFDGTSNVAGTLFADRNSVSGITQSNYIIYGHNMKDNSMFGTFANYVDKSYYDSNPVLYYLTPDANYRIELLCAHTVESTADNYPTYFSSTSDYQAFLNKITSNAYWVNSGVLSTNYQLISMSTCTYTSGYNDPRFMVHGMMIPLD